MRTQLIGPGGLEVDAVVPQCLDNHYVSDSVFAQMMERGLDYRDKEIAALREKDFRTEFVRSLVYSSQVVIQRTFLRNSEFLYKNYTPENVENRKAFAHLVRESAIVPYLYRESSLSDDVDFAVQEEGERALRALLTEVGDEITCVRLAVADAANKRATAAMSSEFGVGLNRLHYMDGGQRNAMASELFSDPQRLQQDGEWKKFSAAVDSLVRYAFDKAGELRQEERLIRRADVYRDIFMLPGDDSIANGRFKKPGVDGPYLLELKKYVDLVYNTNLPDHLKRFTFTPANMPSRMALQDAPGEGFDAEEVSEVLADGDALEAIRRTFMAHTQRAMSLPLLDKLSIADVQQVRALPQWEAFKTAQANILKEPLRCLTLLGEFQDAFDEFQRALSDWYNRTYERAQTEEKYCTFISLALSIGGKLFVAGSHLNAYEKVFANTLVDQGTARIPKKIKGYAAKLLVGVYDIGKQRLDGNRTYSIELMQTSQELTREDVLQLLHSIDRKEGASLPGATEHLSDQGKL